MSFSDPPWKNSLRNGLGKNSNGGKKSSGEKRDFFKPYFGDLGIGNFRNATFEPDKVLESTGNHS